MEPLNTMKLIRPLTGGAAIGGALTGAVYFWFTRRVDAEFWVVVMLGGSAGGAIQGVVKQVLGPWAERRQLQTEVGEVIKLRDTRVISKQKAQELIDKLVEDRFRKCPSQEIDAISKRNESSRRRSDK